MIGKYMKNQWFRVEKIGVFLYFKRSDWNRYNTAKSVFKKSIDNAIFKMPETAFDESRFTIEPFQLVSVISGIFILGRSV